MALGYSWLGATLLAVAVVMVLAWPTRVRSRQPSFQVLVLGDIGRSPRMQYHALSLAQHGPVQLIGYYESDLLDDLARHPRLTRVALRPPPPVLRRVPFVLGGPLKALWQVLDLFAVLAYTTRPAHWLLVQNPPAIPTLAVARLATVLRGTRLLVDWHNYGWTILAGTRGASHPLVSVSKAYETSLGRYGDANLTVTAAMAAQLRTAPYCIPASSPVAVLHDRPAALFQPVPSETPLSPAERTHEIVRILATDGDAPENEDRVAVAALLSQPGTRVLVSSTSWTPDEDFQLLLDALVAYASSGSGGGGGGGAAAAAAPPPVLAIITGKGPQRHLYEQKLEQLAASGYLPPSRVRVCTAFLPSMRDYARLLAVADLGVCLHKSSSGVDLPMKVVDMFGAGLPVVAYSAYASFGELVREGVNGRGFATAAELGTLLQRLLGEKAAQVAELATLRAGARQESELRWADEWDRVVPPLLGLGEGAAAKKKR